MTVDRRRLGDSDQYMLYDLDYDVFGTNLEVQPSADIPSPSLLIHLLKVKGGAAEYQPRGTAVRREFRHPADAPLSIRIETPAKGRGGCSRIMTKLPPGGAGPLQPGPGRRRGDGKCSYKSAAGIAYIHR